MRLKDLSPDIFDHLELEKKGFMDSNDLNEKFSSIYKKYYLFLEKYLNEVLNISKIDNLVSMNDTNMEPVDKKDMDIYQDLSSNKYFYIRNTLYIEKLTEDEINLLNTKEIFDDDIRSLIKNSYKRIITTTMPKDGTTINYGPLAPAFFAQCNALIIGFRYDPLFDGELAKTDDDAWYDNYIKQQVFITNLLNLLNKEFSEKIDIPIQVIKYDENSIKKKANLNNNKSKLL